MRIRSPSSRARGPLRFSAFDIAIAAFAPYLALSLRNAQILNADAGTVALYCFVFLFFSLLSFAVFQVGGALPRYFSVVDVQNVLKAVLVAELLSATTLFTVTRLDGIPRSVPVIHALILAAGLFAVRGLLRVVDNKRGRRSPPVPTAQENLILVGVDDLSVLLIKLLDVCARHRQQVIGLLDPERRMIGRSVHGVRVFGPPSHLEALIEEFAVHGVRTTRVVVSDQGGMLLLREVAEIREVCARRQLEWASVRDLLGPGMAECVIGGEAVKAHPPPRYIAAAPVRTSPYFQRKGRVDFVVASALLLLLWPFWALAVLLAFFDVGSPTLFWQQRVGLHGQDFQLYKIRTLRPAYDRHGQRIPEHQRLSWIGQLLRRTRLDELPQLMNVLVGDMSLIGPRPLLPKDQPADPEVRLMVRPGITGWAQVNGGALLSADDKDALDAWYVENASFWLDLSIIAMTVRSFARGDRRSEAALMQARTARSAARLDGAGSGRQALAELAPVTVEASGSRGRGR